MNLDNCFDQETFCPINQVRLMYDMRDISIMNKIFDVHGRKLNNLNIIRT